MENKKLKDIDISQFSSKHNEAFKNLEEYDKGNYRPTDKASKFTTFTNSKVKKKDD